MKCFFEFYVDFVLVSILSLLLSWCRRNCICPRGSNFEIYVVFGAKDKIKLKKLTQIDHSSICGT